MRDTRRRRMTISEAGALDTMDQGLRASIHFPIEGRSPWVMILRASATGFAGALVLMIAMATVLDMDGDMKMIMGGISAFMLLEYFIMRLLIVPRLADYGRFRVYQNKVDFFPLSMSGLRVSEASDSEPITSFTGVTVRGEAERGMYSVMLLHKEKAGRNVCLKTYNAPQPANSHAEALAQTMGVGYVPFKGGTRKAA